MALAGLAVAAFARHAGFDGQECYNAELCAVEAVTNSVRHAYDGQAGQEVRLRVTLAPGVIEIDVVDRGRPIPVDRRTPAPLPEPDPADIASIAEGGRGLFLIHALMNEVAYTADASGNHLRMVRRIAEPLPSR